MNILTTLYTEALFRPLLNLLIGFANNLPGNEVGWAIVLVTAVVRAILLPLSFHQVKRASENQSKMGAVQTEIKKIQEKHKDDKAKQAEETMKIYRASGVNPASGCLPLLIQLPILIALYRVFLAGLTPDVFPMLYNFVGQPAHLDLLFFGIDLQSPSLRLGVLAGIGQFIQMRFLTTPPAAPTGGDDAAAMTASMQRNMMYIFPVMTIFIALRLPAALALYWLISTLFGIAQQYVFKRFFNISSSTPVA